MHKSRSNRVDSAVMSTNACEHSGTSKCVAPQVEDGDANKTKAESPPSVQIEEVPSDRSSRMKLMFERGMPSASSGSSERHASNVMRAVVDTAVGQTSVRPRLWRAYSSSALGLGTPLDFKRQDLKRFYPNVVRRVTGD